MQREEVEKKVNKGFLTFSNIFVVVWNTIVASIGVVLIKGGIVDHYVLEQGIGWLGLMLIACAVINMYKWFYV